MKSKADIQDWNAIAPVYAEVIEAHGDRCFPEVREHLWETLGDIQGKIILDLGCGQGWMTKKLADQGAKVIGIDGADALISRARSLYPDQSFYVADLANGLPELATEFDIVISHMVVMDIPEIDMLFNSIAQVLKPQGKFLFTLPHPCFFQQKSHQDDCGQWFKKVTGYLNPKTWRIDSFGGHNHYHRTISGYINSLSEAGLLIFTNPSTRGSQKVSIRIFSKRFRYFSWLVPEKLSNNA